MAKNECHIDMESGRSAGSVIEFKEHLKIRHYSAPTVRLYFNQVTNFLLWSRETLSKSAGEITQADILNYEAHLKQNRLTINSRHRYLHSVKRFFKWLQEKHYILIDPYETLKIPRPVQNIPVVLTEKEVKKVISQPNTSTPVGVRDRAMLEVFYSSGIRIGELNNLTIFDIDLSGGFLRINKGKFSKDRFAPLTRASCWWLKLYITNVRAGLTKNDPRETALFVGERGRKLHKEIIMRMVREYAAACGLKKRVTAHAFRHTFAKHLLDNGAELTKIQRLLGHRHISVTQKYTQVTDKDVKRAHSQCHPREQAAIYERDKDL